MHKSVGILLIGIMFFSSIAFAFIQAFYTAPAPAVDQTAAQAQLPSQQIVDYALSGAQVSAAVSRGFTVATYTYDKSCLECANERGLLEQIALSKEFQNQIILQEVEGSGPSSLSMTSSFGQRTLDAIDENSTVAAFCDVVVSPPLGCVGKGPA